MLTERGHKLSVLAVDPSSCASGGEYCGLPFSGTAGAGGALCYNLGGVCSQAASNLSKLGLTEGGGVLGGELEAEGGGLGHWAPQTGLAQDRGAAWLPRELGELGQELKIINCKFQPFVCHT